MDKLKIVKSIVFILTFLLIFGTLLLLGQIYKKTRSSSDVSRHFYLQQPDGSSIADYKTDNGNLILLIKNGGLADRIIIFNPENGNSETTIHINGPQKDDRHS